MMRRHKLVLKYKSEQHKLDHIQSIYNAIDYYTEVMNDIKNTDYEKCNITITFSSNTQKEKDPYTLFFGPTDQIWDFYFDPVYQCFDTEEPEISLVIPNDAEFFDVIEKVTM
ncbi:hypothetical protein ZPAH1_orf00177 [Aeromonas phage ZPAH1]|nr:hypothetical protein ZPAH1_orf00177 [Aeromonas phage ZPAH1]